MSSITRDFVTVTFCVHDNKLLLIHHKKLNIWLPPGGHLNPHELPCSGAVREFKEETGLDIELVGKEEQLSKDVKKLIQPKHIQLEVIEPGHEHIDMIYFGKLIDPEQKNNIQIEEINDLKWFSAEDLDSKDIIEDVRNTGKLALKEIQ